MNKSSANPVEDLQRLDLHIEKLFDIMDNVHEGGYDKTIGFTTKEYTDAYTFGFS